MRRLGPCILQGTTCISTRTHLPQEKWDI